MKKLIREFFAELSWGLGLYTIYINVVNIIVSKEITLIFDGDIIPFFLILAICNLYVQKRKTQNVVVRPKIDE
jgi:intracellular septation protein A